MGESKIAVRLSQDIDRMLRGEAIKSGGTAAEGYVGLLETARVLAATDLSDESLIRAGLRQRRAVPREGSVPGKKKEKSMGGRIFVSRHLKGLLLAALVTSAFAFVMACPATREAIRDGIASLGSPKRVGANTSIVVMGADADSGQGRARLSGAPQIVEPDPEDTFSWCVLTSAGNYGGNVGPGEDATVRRMKDGQAAEKVCGFLPRYPEWMPEGYSLREILAVNGNALMFYSDGPGEIVIYEAHVFSGTPGGLKFDGEDPDFSRRGVVMSTTGSVIDTDVGGWEVVWLTDDHQLVWEKGVCSLSVAGIDLAQETAERIAASMK